MGYLRAKSEFNIEASQLLIDKGIFAPSVHCSYYGCFQFIKYKLNAIGVTYAYMSTEIAKDEKKKSHNYPIKLITDKITSKKDKYISKQINDDIKLLKSYRQLSDYDNSEVNYDMSKKSLELSNGIIKFLKTL